MQFHKTLLENKLTCALYLVAICGMIEHSVGLCAYLFWNRTIFGLPVYTTMTKTIIDSIAIVVSGLFGVGVYKRWPIITGIYAIGVLTYTMLHIVFYLPFIDFWFIGIKMSKLQTAFIPGFVSLFILVINSALGVTIFMKQMKNRFKWWANVPEPQQQTETDDGIDMKETTTETIDPEVPAPVETESDTTTTITINIQDEVGGVEYENTINVQDEVDGVEYETTITLEDEVDEVEYENTTV